LSSSSEHVGIIDAAHAHQRGDADGERRVSDCRDGLEVEDRVLRVDEDEVVARRLGDARDIGRAAESHGHAERDAARLHDLLDGVGQFGGV
jgi:hypothetical protein